MQYKGLSWEDFGWDNVYSNNFKYDEKANSFLKEMGILDKKDNKVLNKIRNLDLVPPIKFIYD